MECRQAIRSASRGMRTASSLLRPTHSSMLLQQQQRLQSSSPSNPNRSAIDDLLANSPYKQPAPAPPSRPSVLSSPRGAGLSSILPPRPPRSTEKGKIPNNNNPTNHWALGSRLAKTIEADAQRAAGISGINRSLTPWNTDEFLKKHNLDKVEDLRLTPSVGRMIHVQGNVDARVAFTRVNGLVKLNGLTKMAHQQRSYERPALRRKRRLREAWRLRFRKGFNAVIHRTMELRKQGW
ncbi:hypothetical protein V8F33_005660 [Rhypophila sp. PSN 637]